MEDYITPERTANAIMQDTRFGGYYLIVEGKKDVKLYGKFVNEEKIRIKPAFGHEKVKEIMEMLDERGFKKRVGIIDSDFRRILNISENIEGLFITDDHDIEVMIIKTKALENVLNIYCSKDKIVAFENKTGISIRDALFALGKEIGYLKLANKIYDLGLVFKPEKVDGNQLKYKSLACTENFNFLGTDILIETALNYSVNKSSNIKDKNTISEKLKEIRKEELDLMQLVNGHDLSNFLYVLMKNIIKSKNKMLNDFNCIEDSLILAYEFSYFKETHLYKKIVKWSETTEIKIFQDN